MPRKTQSSNVLKDNWYLILALVVLLVGGAIAAFMSGRNEEPLPTGVIGSAGEGVDVVRVSAEEAQEDKPTVGYQGMSAEERDQRYIEDYQAKLAEDPYGEHVPETMIALATVYRRQGNFDDAAIIMEDLVEKFPDNPHARTARIQLPEVYESAGDVAMARASYQRMIEFFPPETQEHQWAQQRYSQL